MTSKDAIMYLNMLFHDSTDEDYCATELFANAVKCGIEALEKQVPMKVVGDKTKVKARDVELNEVATFICMQCPSCEVWQSRNDKYCSNCGQRLDWAEEVSK